MVIKCEAKLRVEFHNWLASHVPDMEPAKGRPGVSRPCMSFPEGQVSQLCAINTRLD
jgi:hypothetical protein